MKRLLAFIVLAVLFTVPLLAGNPVDTTQFTPGTSTDWALTIQNILLGVYVIGMIVYRLAPTNGKWEWLLWPLKIIDMIIPNRSKTGGSFKV